MIGMRGMGLRKRTRGSSIMSLDPILNIPSCQMILDPQYSRVNRDNLVMLLDLSGTYHFLANSTTNISLGQFRGNKSINFNRQLNTRLTNRLSSGIDFGSNFTLYIVGNFLNDVTNDWAWIFSVLSSSGLRNPSFYITYFLNKLRVSYGNFFTEVGLASYNGVGLDTVIRVSRESNVIRVWERFSRINSDISVGTVNIGNSSNVCIGSLADANNTGLGGDLGLVLGFSGVLSNHETATVENYIRTRFGGF